MINPAMIGKAKKAYELQKKVLPPLTIYENEPLKEGKAVYTFQAKFNTPEEAEQFKQLYQLSQELEKYMHAE